MNRFLPALLLCAVSIACSRTEAAASDPAATPPAVRFEEVSRRKVRSPEEQVFVRLRVVNGGTQGIGYPGWADDSPTYSLEVQESGAWERYNTGWCGTGLLDFMLKPGSEMAFEVMLPADGKTYRASFGNPLIVTPPLVATAP